MIYHLKIDYDEGVEASYRGVVLQKQNGRDAHRWNSGDPQKDWADYRAFAEAKK